MILAVHAALRMRHPWLDIPLAEYEAHMALPQVAQTQLLAGILGAQVAAARPASVAVVGCAGGNGFEAIDPTVTRRVVGIDINAQYLETAGTRHRDRFARLELHALDIAADDPGIAPVDLVFAALVLEYVEVAPTLANLRAMLAPAGKLVTVVQLPDEVRPAVTPSPYPSLAKLEPILRHVDPGRLHALAGAHGLAQTEWDVRATPTGKRFAVQAFQAR